MARRISGYYWCLQLGGWGLFLLLPLLNLPGNHAFEKSLIYILPGLLTTHLLRTIILRYGWLELPLKKGLLRLFAGALSACILAALLSESAQQLAEIKIPQSPHYLSTRSVYRQTINYIFPILSWAMIYALHYYARKIHKEDIKRRELELRLEEKELQARGLSVSIDLLIDSLNRIQTSIDENPARSREEITEFSNLLRRGYLNPLPFHPSNINQAQ